MLSVPLPKSSVFESDPSNVILLFNFVKNPHAKMWNFVNLQWLQLKNYFREDLGSAAHRLSLQKHLALNWCIKIISSIFTLIFCSRIALHLIDSTAHSFPVTNVSGENHKFLLTFPVTANKIGEGKGKFLLELISFLLLRYSMTKLSNKFPSRKFLDSKKYSHKKKQGEFKLKILHFRPLKSDSWHKFWICTVASDCYMQLVEVKIDYFDCIYRKHCSVHEISDFYSLFLALREILLYSSAKFNLELFLLERFLRSIEELL